jgi:hypothetical protein
VLGLAVFDLAGSEDFSLEAAGAGQFLFHALDLDYIRAGAENQRRGLLWFTAIALIRQIIINK